MDVLHITQTKNLKSIMKHGILKTKPLLYQYEEVMQKEYGDKYDSDKGMVFGIPETVLQRDKYIKDFFYWKTWAGKRNMSLTNLTYKQYDNCREIGPKVFSKLKINPLGFSVLLIDIPHHPVYDRYIHQQSHHMAPHWGDMDVRFEHDDKPLTLINYDIPPYRIKRVVGTGESTIGRNEKINISLKI